MNLKQGAGHSEFVDLTKIASYERGGNPVLLAFVCEGKTFSKKNLGP